MNLLFERVRRAFEAPQHFVADAAHEQRSPLAALKLQLQGRQRAVAAGRIAAGIDRATHLVEQLLALARQEASAVAVPPPSPYPSPGT
ncbi:histidine kinase dimerization/phospho-acceptor domain-containing protein, partial [Escherichia coli]|uniref:histidine kinase dimerization/phospho-acceptor domain-containing protein n=1 Tax=Escherichia coli TaxID=562 RepID=UPI002557B674